MTTYAHSEDATARELTTNVVRTHRGRTRSTNQDRFLAMHGTYAVADGVAGAPAGDVAARIAIEELADAPPVADEDALAAVAARANRLIHDSGERDPDLAGMATTLTAGRLDGDRLLLAHVGDSRAYRLRDGRLERLTDDHSFAGEAVHDGILDADTAARSPFRGLLTRALGALPEVEVDSSTHQALPGDLYLLCTDGLTSAVPDGRLAEILKAHQPVRDVAARLIEAALEAGAPDNVTVVLFRVPAAEEDS